MSIYRKVDTRIWGDAKFARLSDDAKLTFLRILTHPEMTMLGGLRQTIGGLADESGWKQDRSRKALSEVISCGMAVHDSQSHLIGLPNFTKYNPPESPNVVKSWGKAFERLPECDLRTLLASLAVSSLEGKAKAFHEALPKAFQEAFDKAKGQVFGKGMPNQEQEHLGNKERTQPHGPSTPSTGSSADASEPEPDAQPFRPTIVR